MIIFTPNYDFGLLAAYSKKNLCAFHSEGKNGSRFENEADKMLKVTLVVGIFCVVLF